MIFVKLLLAFLCILSLAYLVLLLRSFEFLPVSELKRRAQTGDKDAAAVYSVRGVYGSGVYIFIWASIGVLSSAMIMLLESTLSALPTVLITMPVVVLVHAVLPISKYPRPGIGLARFSVPVIRRILFTISPVLSIIEKIVGSWVSHTELSSMHSKEELLGMIRNANNSSTTLTKNELLIATHALTFGEKKVGDIYIPISVVSTIDSATILSAVTLDELYKTGFSRFPVTSNNGGFVGVLYMKDLAGKMPDTDVAHVMSSDVYYVNEQSGLDHVLNAFLRTKHHLFFVVNEFEEVSGIVTIEDVIEQIIGRKIIDEFDKYDDLRVVARQIAQQTAKARTGTVA
jgi:CBS domain containing-hemolysin-like protein